MGLVQHAQGYATSGSTVSATFGSSTAGGASIIVCVSNQSGKTVSSIALTGSSDTFTKAVSALESTFGEDAEIWIDASDSSGHTTVTVTFSGTITDAEIDIYEWSGISSGTADKTHTGTSTSGTTSFSSGSTGTLTQASEVAFGAVAVNTEGGGATTLTGPPSPWTNETQINAGTGISQLSGYQQVSATTALTYSGTGTVQFSYASCIATFKLTTAGPGPAGTVQPRATVPVPRHPARAVIRFTPVTTTNAVPAVYGLAPGQPYRAAPRRIPARAAWRGLAAAPRRIAAVQPPRQLPRIARRHAVRAYVRFNSVTTVNVRTLIISLASAAGTDDYGHTFPQGIQVGSGQVGPQVQIVPSQNGSAAGIGFPMPAPALAFIGNIAAEEADGAGLMLVSGPQLAQAGARDWVQLQLWSNDGNGTPSRLQVNTIDTNGNVTEAGQLVNGSGWTFETPVSATDGLTVSGGETVDDLTASGTVTAADFTLDSDGQMTGPNGNGVFGWSETGDYPASTGSSTFGGGAGCSLSTGDFNATAISDLETLQDVANSASALANYIYQVLQDAGIIAGG